MTSEKPKLTISIREGKVVLRIPKELTKECADKRRTYARLRQIIEVWSHCV